MISKESKFNASDGVDLYFYEWLPEVGKEITGVVQISHGMAEHALRYKNFASFLSDNGFAVYANDLRGHGKTAGDLENVGFVQPNIGWDKFVSDFKEINLMIQERHKDKPYFVFGHSMGSLLIRKFLLDTNNGLKGAILSGSPENPGIVGNMGFLATKVLMLFNPAKSPSPFMDNLSFGAFNKIFKPNRTKFDWLSRDNDQVDKYVADPYCGGVFSLGFFHELLRGIAFVSKQKNINKTSADLPILIFSGEKDSVGNNGKSVAELLIRYKRSGLHDVTLKLFPDARHEMLNETNKKEVYHYILEWIECH